MISVNYININIFIKILLVDSEEKLMISRVFLTSSFLNNRFKMLGKGLISYFGSRH